METRPIRLLSIEDHPLMISGLRNFFRSGRDGVAVVKTACRATQAIKEVLPEEVDVILLDLFLDTDDPLDNIAILSRHYPGKPIVIYTGHTGTGLMRTVFDLGIRAWILKSTPPKEIRDTIERVFRGEIITPRELNPGYSVVGSNTPVTRGSLSHFQPDRQQLELLRWLAEGYTTSEIAQNHLNVTRSTVEKRIQAMREAAEVKTNCELVGIYVRFYAPRE